MFYVENVNNDANASAIEVLTTHLLNIVLRQSRRSNVHSILLHVLAHIGIFDYGLSLFCHGRSLMVVTKILPDKARRV